MIPQWRGLRVPYIALWTDEQVGPDMVSGPRGVEPAAGTKWVTKEFGMWMISGPTSRTGHPLFGETHSRRQRKCMTEVRCQVCGEHRRGQMLWVIPNAGDHPVLWGDHRWAINAPVCEPCYEIARVICPHLLETDPLTVVKGRSMPVAVQGDLLRGEHVIKGAVAPLRHPITAQMVGRELVVAVEPEKGTT